MVAAFLLLFTPQTTRIVVKPQNHAKKVAVVGDFNDWNAPGEAMTSDKEGTAWQIDLKLKPGVYRYVILEDGATVPTGDELKKAQKLIVITPPEYARHVGVRGDGIITDSVVVHGPDRHDTKRTGGRAFELTLRTRKEDVTSVSVTAWNDGHEQKIYPMALAETDPLFDYYRVKVVVNPDLPLLYRFMVNDGRGSRAYDTAGLSQGMISGGQPFRQDLSSYKEPEVTKPSSSEPASPTSGR